MSQAIKNVLITGAAKRLGREIALTFARAGWGVAVHYGHSAAEAVKTVNDCQALGVACVALQADLQDLNAVAQLVPQAIAALGGLSCVVNSASTFEYDSATSFDANLLQKHLHPNLSAPLLLAKSLYESLGKDDTGCVVNILDQKLAFYNPDFFSYTLTKAALEAATTMLAQGLAPKLRVVGVSPGLTLPSFLQDDAAYAKAQTLSLTGHSSSAADVAATVLFAVQNQSITGCTLRVDGGQPHMGLRRDVSYL
jgi:NAD(P)-dependent dehydrogenase (short-subunit alcohol dehydrogenase family)